MFRFVLLLAVIFCGGCSSADMAGKQDAGGGAGTLKMGAILPLSAGGAEGYAAGEILSGMRLAAEEYEKKSPKGEKLDLQIRDCSAPEFAFTETLRSMRDGGVRMFHIALADSIVAYYSIFGKMPECFFNLMTTYPPATTGADNTTRIFINGAQEGDLLTEQIEVLDRKQRYVIMNVDTLNGRSNAAYFAFNLNKGSAKAYTDVFKSGEENFGAFTSQIGRLLPRFIFYIGDGSELEKFSESVGKADYSGVLLANCGLVPFEKIKPVKGGRFGKIRTAFEAGNLKTKISESFKSDYMARYGKPPSWLAAYGYDAVRLFAQAARGGADSKLMRKFFSGKNYDAAIGMLKFDASADSLSELEIVEIK